MKEILKYIETGISIDGNPKDGYTVFTREMILNIIQTMSLDEAADEIYEMITEICRYR